MIITPSHPSKIMQSRRNPNNLSVSSTTTSASAASIPSASSLSPRLPLHRMLLSPTPPPSPGLPALLPRHGKKPGHGHLQVRRYLLAFVGLFVLAWMGARHLYLNSEVFSTPFDRVTSEGEYEMVAGSLLPEHPSVVVVADRKGRPRWTVSIPQSYDFPLRPAHYREICSQSMEIAHQLEHSSKKKLKKRHHGYYYEDPNFIDVQDAVEEGLLPFSYPMGKPDSAVLDHQNEWTEPSKLGSASICTSSLTYVLETSDAGLGKSLLALWMAYGLAQKEGRAFFIDDTRWPYGNYSTYFIPPPAPACLPPPKTHIVPCPHSARHILVSAATTGQAFGHTFIDEFEDPKKMEVQRQHSIFALLRAGYEALFKLNSEDADYVSQRASSLYDHIHGAGGVSVALHVRRGDRHPYEFQYSKDYLPLDRYLDTARDLMFEHFAALGSVSGTNDTRAEAVATARRKAAVQAAAAAARRPSAEPDRWDEILGRFASQLILASDDPDIYGNPEMAPTVRAQDHIVLASKATLEAAGAGKSSKYIDEVSGWEGGFFRDVFWSLGGSGMKTGSPARNGWRGAAPSPNANLPGSSFSGDRIDEYEEPSAQAMRLRELVGRAYLLDLAVLGRADAVVCTVSSMGCRILGVMMGWEEAIQKEKWRNVDGRWYWRGIEW